MVEGWGDDFDEDGNVIGEVPDSEGGFFEEHWKAVLVATLAVFLVQLPRVTAASDGLGGLLGGAIGALIIGIPLAYAGVKLRGML